MISISYIYIYIHPADGRVGRRDGARARRRAKTDVLRRDATRRDAT